MMALLEVAAQRRQRVAGVSRQWEITASAQAGIAVFAMVALPPQRIVGLRRRGVTAALLVTAALRRHQSLGVRRQLMVALPAIAMVALPRCLAMARR